MELYPQLNHVFLAIYKIYKGNNSISNYSRSPLCGSSTYVIPQESEAIQVHSQLGGSLLILRVKNKNIRKEPGIKNSLCFLVGNDSDL